MKPAEASDGRRGNTSMRWQRVAIAASASLIVLMAGWYWGSPWWTLWRMREWAVAGDAERLATYVDFAALTAEGRADTRRFWGSVLTTVHPHNDIARQFRNLAKRKLASVDTIVFRSEDIRPWLAEIPVGFAGFRSARGRRPYRIYIEHRGLDEFRVRDRDSPENGGMLTFRRHGLGWKLAGVRFGSQ
jgi:hypothetical protein